MGERERLEEETVGFTNMEENCKKFDQKCSFLQILSLNMFECYFVLGTMVGEPAVT